MSQIHRQTILNGLLNYSPKMVRRFESLSEEDWALDSRCANWSVKDVACHMYGAFNFYFGSINRAKNGIDVLPDGSRDPGVADGKTAASFVSERTMETSRTVLKTPEATLEGLSSIELKLMDEFRSLDDHEWDLQAYHPVNWISPYGLLLWKLIETAIHSWDAFNAIDHLYEVDGDLASLLPKLWSYPLINRWFKTPDLASMERRVVEVDFGSGEGLLITSSDGDITIEEYNPGNTPLDGKLRTTASEFALLITGRQDLKNSLTVSYSDFSGDPACVEAFSRWFTGA